MARPFRVTSGRSWVAPSKEDIGTRPRCSGVSGVEAKTMFYALYKFGRHWKFPIKRAKPVKFEGQLVARAEPIPRAIPVNPTEINEAHDWIQNSDPSLEQIEQRANTEAW